jgi:hypothetical protein
MDTRFKRTPDAPDGGASFRQIILIGAIATVLAFAVVEFRRLTGMPILSFLLAGICAFLIGGFATALASDVSLDDVRRFLRGDKRTQARLPPKTLPPRDLLWGSLGGEPLASYAELRRYRRAPYPDAAFYRRRSPYRFVRLLMLIATWLGATWGTVRIIGGGSGWLHYVLAAVIGLALIVACGLVGYLVTKMVQSFRSRQRSKTRKPPD